MYFIEHDGVRLHCSSMGSGPPLVLCHGLVFGSMASWYFSIATKLAQRYRVILYDQRGHGKSTLAANGYDVATLAGDLAAVIAHEIKGDEAVGLIGHSYGALVALQYCLERQATPQKTQRVRSLVLIDAPLPAAHYVLPSIANVTSSAALTAQFPDALRAQLASGGRRAEQLQKRLEFLLLQSSLRADVAAAGDVADAQLRDLALPVLCVYGRESDCTAAGVRLAQQLPQATLEWLDCGHYILQEAPSKLLNTLNNFADL